MKKLIRITTVPGSLASLLEGQMGYMKQYYEVVGISSPIDNGIEFVSKQEGVRVLPVEMTRKISPLKDLIAVFRLYKIFRKEKPFIVHTHTPKAGTVGMLAAWFARVPNRLHTIAGLPLLVATGPKRKLLDLVEKITYKCATRIYPNSHGLRDIIVKNRYTRSSKLKVIGQGSSNGIDTKHFNPNLFNEELKNKLKNKLNIGFKDFVYVYVGRMVKDKGLEELTSAFTKINLQFPNTKLLLLGNYEKDLDPLSKKAEHIIENHESVIYVGSQSDVRPFFCISDILVFPSYREGFPNVVMQAGALGIPSIVSDINGCNEIIVQNINGKIIPAKDEKSLIEEMMIAYKNQSYIKKMGLESRKMITNRYERLLIWEKLRLEYKTLE